MTKLNTLNRKRYVANLQKLQAICSRNYSLLLRLLPVEYELKDKWQLQLADGLCFELEVTEVSRYTDVFRLQQRSNHLPKAMAMNIEFRAYHDAQMVEVLSFQNHSKIRANNPYPNDKLHHKDEKQQVNALLKDWLNLAVNHQNNHNNQTLGTT